MYSVEDDNSLEQITSRWLPLLRTLRPAVREEDGVDSGPICAIPVVLVGNKSDLLEQGNMEAVLPVMNQYAEIETCVEVI